MISQFSVPDFELLNPTQKIQFEHCNLVVFLLLFIFSLNIQQCIQAWFVSRAHFFCLRCLPNNCWSSYYSFTSSYLFRKVLEKSVLGSWVTIVQHPQPSDFLRSIQLVQKDKMNVEGWREGGLQYFVQNDSRSDTFNLLL